MRRRFRVERLTSSGIPYCHEGGVDVTSQLGLPFEASLQARSLEGHLGCMQQPDRGLTVLDTSAETILFFYF